MPKADGIVIKSNTKFLVKKASRNGFMAPIKTGCSPLINKLFLNSNLKLLELDVSMPKII